MKTIKAAIFVAVFVLVVAAVNLFLFYVIGSAATSAIKLVNGDCGKTYPAEDFVYGNIFCNTQKVMKRLNNV